MVSKKVKSEQKPEAKSQTTKKTTRKVWHITDFRELFELTDDVRKKRPGPLSYTKSQVTLSGLSKEEEIRHFEMMRILKSRSERHLLRSVFEDLKNWTAGKHYGPRGYLVTTDGKPASYEYLAAQLQINVDDLKQAMPILAEIGLIERVPLNVLLDGTGPSRTHPDTSRSKRHPLKNGKAKGKGKNKRNTQKATNGLTAVDKDKKINDKAYKHKANAQSKGESKGQDKDEPPSAPTTTPPSEPQGSDALGGSNVILFTAPRGSVKPDRGQQQPAMATVVGNYNRYDEQFGTRLYVALGFKRDVNSPEARREICSFASKFAHARARLSDLPPPVIDELGRRAVNEARKIGRKGRRNFKPGAVLNKVIDKLVEARLREAM